MAVMATKTAVAALPGLTVEVKGQRFVEALICCAKWDSYCKQQFSSTTNGSYKNGSGVMRIKRHSCNCCCICYAPLLLLLSHSICCGCNIYCKIDCYAAIATAIMCLFVYHGLHLLSRISFPWPS